MKQKKLTDIEIKSAIDNAKGIFAIEGMEIPKESVALAENSLTGQITVDEFMKSLIENYSKEKL